MKKKNQCRCQDDNGAFTLAEMMIVVVIVLILATAAISGSQSVIKNLRFGNTFNKIIFMVQSARSMAITGKNEYDQPVKAYQVRFNIEVAPQSVALIATLANDTEETVENFTIEETTELRIFADELGTTPTSCTSGGTDPAQAMISFTYGTTKLTLHCNGLTPPLIQFGVRDTTTNSERKFLMHQAAGIPQIQ